MSHKCSLHKDRRTTKHKKTWRHDATCWQHRIMFTTLSGFLVMIIFAPLGLGSIPYSFVCLCWFRFLFYRNVFLLLFEALLKPYHAHVLELQENALIASVTQLILWQLPIAQQECKGQARGPNIVWFILDWSEIDPEIISMKFEKCQRNNPYCFHC